MEKFEIVLKNEKIKSYNRISWIIIFIHYIIYVFLGFSSDRFISSTAITGFIFLSVLFLFRIFIKEKKWRPGPHLFFLFLGVGWICLHAYWLAIIPFIFDFLFSAATAKQIAKFSTEGIHYPSFPPKKISWSDLTNLMLKDGLLTIDFKNNRIIQQMTEELTTPVDEKIFNEFCQAQLRPI